MNKYILGVANAWTSKEPSGVALLEISEGNKPKIVKIGRSFDEFLMPSIRVGKESVGL